MIFIRQYLSWKAVAVLESLKKLKIEHHGIVDNLL